MKITFLLLFLSTLIISCNVERDNRQTKNICFSKRTNIFCTAVASSINNLSFLHFFNNIKQTKNQVNNFNDIVYAEFDSAKYVSQMEIISSSQDSITLIINDLYFGQYLTNTKISVNTKIQSIIFRIYPCKNYYVNSYMNTQKISFLHPTYNSSHGLRQICFWDKKQRLISFYNNLDSTNIFTETRCDSMGNKSFFLDTVFYQRDSSLHLFCMTRQSDIFSFVESDSLLKIFAGKYEIEENFYNQSKVMAIGKYWELCKNDGFINNYTEDNQFKISITAGAVYQDSVIKIYTTIPDSSFVEVNMLDTNILLDIKYATDKNFTRRKLYDCEKCLLRYFVAKDLVSANKELQQIGLGIKIFDGYRPLSVQFTMWDSCPNINFVANPVIGSIHNRGTAVDITLIDNQKKELDMGTEYDYFGYESFHDNQLLSDTINNNRHLLRAVLYKNNFFAIKTEWWHYAHFRSMFYPLSDFELPCP